MLGYDIPDDEGYRIAEALGLDAFADLGAGLDGKVFALDDGRILKISLKLHEAALAQQILAGEIDRDGIVFPRIFDVRSAALDDGTDAWAIVREEVGDVFEDPSEEEKLDMPVWRVAAGHVARAAAENDPAMLEMAIAYWGRPEPDLRPFAHRLRQLVDEGVLQIGDLGPNNIGRTRDGQVKVRDYGGFRLAETRLVAACEAIQPLCSLAQAP